jgi:hypothetical protein
VASCAPGGVGKHHGCQTELRDAMAGSENGRRRSAMRRRSRQQMVKKWTAALRLLSEDGGSRRCSTQWRFSGVEGRRPEVVIDGSGGGSARPSGERSG